MNYLELKGIKFHKIDDDNDIEIECEGWSKYISIEETEKLIEFLSAQIGRKEQTIKSE